MEYESPVWDQGMTRSPHNQCEHPHGTAGAADVRAVHGARRVVARRSAGGRRQAPGVAGSDHRRRVAIGVERPGHVEDRPRIGYVPSVMVAFSKVIPSTWTKFDVTPRHRW